MTLHTGVGYSKNFKEAFCSISESERHDAASVVAHLIPIIERYLELFPLTTNLHLLSDGPTTQYRNKTYFYLLTKLIRERFPQLLSITHNFGEAGHGKWGPDGVGGALKNIADDVVAHGTDVSNFESFKTGLEKDVKTVHLAVIKDESIKNVDKVVPKGILPPGEPCRFIS